MVPRSTPRALPDGAAQDATNARLVSGDLEPFQRPLLVKALANVGAVSTIHLMAGEHWLSWEEEVEVARGQVAGDDTYRTYITGLDVPRFTNLELATTGSEPYPVETRPLGVSAPVEAPVLTVLPPAVVEGDVPITNPGAEVGTTGWVEGSGDLVAHDDDDIVGQLPYAGTHFFGHVGVTEATQDITVEDADVGEGRSIELVWQQAHGPNDSEAAMGVRFLGAADVVLGEVLADLTAPGADHAWTQRSISGTVPADTEKLQLVMQFAPGASDDAYIDGIVVNQQAYSLGYDGSDLSSWTISEHGMLVDGAFGQPAPSFQIDRDDTKIPFMWQQVDSDKSPAFRLTYDVFAEIPVICTPYCTVDGVGMGVSVDADGVTVRYLRSWGDSDGTKLTNLYTGDAYDRWLTVELTSRLVSPAMADMIVTVIDKATGEVIVDGVAVDDWRVEGGVLAFRGRPRHDHDSWIDNINLQLDPPDTDASNDPVYTSYVFTYVNDLGEQGPPSPVSEVIQRNINSAVTVVTPGTVPTGLEEQGITYKRIYRAATGASGTGYLLVVETPLATEEYTDSKTDAELGEALETEDYDPPHAELRGIIALPNGVMCGFFRNQLCLSVQNRPHAWPVAWRLTTDSDIVAICNVDNTVIIGTETFVYTASGTDPSAYSMSKPGAPQACTSRRSMAYLIGFGVVFAGPDGFMVARSSTQVENLTEAVFTRKQWQMLDPTSILTVVHDNVITFFWANGSLSGGFRLDLANQGAGLVAISCHAQAAYVDPQSDALYLVLDSYAEPTHELLPTGTEVELAGVDGQTIFEWEADESLMVYRWRGKLHLLPHPMALQWAQVKAADYGALVFRCVCDGAVLDEALLTSVREFRLPVIDDYREVEVELIGTSRVRQHMLADDVSELR